MTHVIACIDGSRSSEFVCDYAAWASRRLTAPLSLLHVTRAPRMEGPSDLSGNIGIGSREHLLEERVALEEQQARLAREQGKAILADAMTRVQSQGVPEAERLLRHGSITETLGELQERARLVVLGKQGRDGDMVERHVGSHLESIIRQMHRPILVSPLAYREPERFLVAYDGSDTADKVLDRVAQSPLLKGLPAHLLFVGADTQANQDRLEQARQVLVTKGFEVRAEIRAGDVADAICAYRREHDTHLMAMGAFGHSRLRQFFVGSTTTKMIMQSPMPLLIMR
ncbi:MAG: universal stress protein [Chromatiales bacterium]|jgi:nucleotide-binding universal stress UspA family protein|nr:universal stress protein [Chromatiales bacterium]